MCVRDYPDNFHALLACNQILEASCRVVSVSWGQMSVGNSSFTPPEYWFVWFEYTDDTDLDALDDAIGSREYRGGDLDRLNELQALMVDGGGSYPQPMYLNQLRYLSGMTGRADQRPGNFAYSRFDELTQKLADLKARFARVTGGEE